jgi:hypothetical protein
MNMNSQSQIPYHWVIKSKNFADSESEPKLNTITICYLRGNIKDSARKK